MTFTYEQIEQLGRKVLCRYCNGAYDLHELVNSVWLAGRAQKAAKITHCIHLMKCDAIDYMRRCEGRTKLRFHSIQARRERASDEGGRQMDLLGSDVDGPLEHVIAGELRRFLLRGLTRLEKLVLTMTWSGFNCREIGQVAGYSESMISIVRTRVLEKCRETVRHYDKNETTGKN